MRAPRRCIVKLDEVGATSREFTEGKQLQSPRFDLMTFRLRRARRAPEVGGNANASCVSGAMGFDAGTNASKNNVAGRSQMSIAALSIWIIPSVGIATERGCLQLAPRTIRAHTGVSISTQGTFV